MGQNLKGYILAIGKAIGLENGPKLDWLIIGKK